MGRLPSHGAPQFRFLPAEVAEMEATARELTGSIFPGNDVVAALAAKFSASPERAGKVVILPKQVMTWFHNRRYAPRSKDNKLKGIKGKTTGRPPSGLGRASSSRVRPSALGSASSDPGRKCTGSGPSMGQMMPPRSNTQRRSVPFEVTECVSVRCRDVVLCFQESEELAFYCDASVQAIQRTEHDSTECFCKFLVCFEHDNSEEIVTLAKLRRRLETDHRVQNFPAARAADSADCHVQQTVANVNLASNENSGKADQKDENQHKNTHDPTMASNSEHEKPATNTVSAEHEVPVIDISSSE